MCEKSYLVSSQVASFKSDASDAKWRTMQVMLSDAKWCFVGGNDQIVSLLIIVSCPVTDLHGAITLVLGRRATSNLYRKFCWLGKQASSPMATPLEKPPVTVSLNDIVDSHTLFRCPSADVVTPMVICDLQQCIDLHPGVSWIYLRIDAWFLSKLEELKTIDCDHCFHAYQPVRCGESASHSYSGVCVSATFY